MNIDISPSVARHAAGCILNDARQSLMDGFVNTAKYDVELAKPFIDLIDTRYRGTYQVIYDSIKEIIDEEKEKGL